MLFVSRQTKASNVVTHWQHQYSAEIKSKSGEHYKTFLALKDLGANPTPGQVNVTIGNESWTRCTCDECGASVNEVMRLGAIPDYSSNTAWICESCLRTALELFEDIKCDAT